VERKSVERFLSRFLAATFSGRRSFLAEFLKLHAERLGDGAVRDLAGVHVDRFGEAGVLRTGGCQPGGNKKGTFWFSASACLEKCSEK